MTASNVSRKLTQLTNHRQWREDQKLAMQCETLTEEEIATITGYLIPSGQIAWLNRNGWKYVLTRARRPVVGRVYARMKLAGVKPSAENVAAEAWSLDLSKVG